MLVGEVLIREISSVDGLATGAVKSCDVTPLDHELGNDSVEDAPLVVEGLAKHTHTLLSGAKATKVFSSNGDGVSKELEDDAASYGAAYCHIKEYLGVIGNYRLLLDSWSLMI